MRQKALVRKLSDDTKLLLSQKHGNPVNIYEKKSKGGTKLIGCFSSAIKAANHLGISVSTVNRYVKSGLIFKDRYLFLIKKT